MSTTKDFQKLPDFYLSKEGCQEYYEKKKESTNPRYPHFNQMYFTAGDVEQFDTYRDSTNGDRPNPIIDMSDNVWYQFSRRLRELEYPKIIKDVIENADWDKYRNLTTESVDNTFHYIFDKFKKGIFIKIKNNELDVFLPFSKNDYINEWSDRIKYDPKRFRDMVDFIQFANKQCGYDVPREKINKFVDRWYGNNCLIRPEFPVGENDRGISNIKDMFSELVKTRVVPDIEFFINKRDFPLITKSEFEPYEQIFGVETFPLLSHKYDKYSPILSMVTTNKHSDIPFPTHEDWARVSSQEDGKFFSPDCRDYRYNFSKEWIKKKPFAVFRGASTGCGVTIDTNQRLKLSYLSSISPKDEKGNKILDAGITKWNLRPRKVMSSDYLQMIDPKTLPFGLVESLTPEQQADYKYIVNVDGHVNAFRLSLEMSMGSVILLADSKYRIWFRRYLKEYVHYVPVSEDLSDLFEKIRWCREHDKECEQIAKNAKEFYQRYLKKNGILDYLQYLLFSLKQSTGTYFYNTVKVEDIIRDMEEKRINEIQNNQNYVEDEEEDEDKKDDDVDIIDIINIMTLNFPFDKEKRGYYENEGLGMALRSKPVRTSMDMNIKDIKGIDIIHQSRDTVTYKKKVTKNDLDILIKTVKTEQRQNQLVNESFCGLSEINKLCKELPHFRYTYMFDKNTLFSEYVNGVTLKDYILSGKCDIKRLIDIFVMLTLALGVAQERCGFVHYDLYPWNVIITKTKKQKIIYQIGEHIFSMVTDIVPVIIDYGRSHVISSYKDKPLHYGTIEPFKTSRYQDIFCMVVSTIYEFTQIPKGFIVPKDMKKLSDILNYFISESTFHHKKLENYQEVMGFLVKHKKYNEMIFGNKCELEKKSPIDFFFYLSELDDVDIPVTQYQFPEKAPYTITHSNPVFYYKLIMGKDPNPYIFEYLEKVERMYEYIMSYSPNILSYVNTCNDLLLNMYGVFHFLTILKNTGMYTGDLLEKNLRIVDMRIATRIKMKFMTYQEEKEKNLYLDYFMTKESFVLAKYTPKMFSVPQKILTLIQSYMKEYDTYMIDMKNILIKNFFYDMPLQIDEQNEFAILKKNRDVLKLSRLITINDMANLNTLKEISSVLYPSEKKVFEKIENPPKLLIQIMDSLISLSV